MYLNVFKHCNFQLCGRYFGLLKVDGLIPNHAILWPSQIQGSHQSSPLNSKWLHNGIENTGVEFKLPPWLYQG